MEKYINSSSINVKKNDWRKRFFKAVEQESIFNLNSDNFNYDNHKNIVKNIIKQFIKKEIKNVKKDNMDSYIEEVDMTHIRAGHEELDTTLEKHIRNMHKSLVSINDQPNGKTRDYLFIVQRNDGMVVVVGKSSFQIDLNNKVVKWGDLFKNMDLNGLVGTPKLILMSILGKEYEKYLEKINQYYKCGWAFPLPDNLPKPTKDLEELLGEELIKNNVPIFNYYSHRFK